MSQLEGNSCIVTGAGQGMGRAIAVELARRGAAVVVVDINEATGRETAELVRAEGAKAEFIRTDLTQPAQIAQMIDATVEVFGGLDVLVNNAGVIDTAFAENPTIETLEERVWDLVFGVNLKAMSGELVLCRLQRLAHALARVGQQHVDHLGSHV